MMVRVTLAALALCALAGCQDEEAPAREGEDAAAVEQPAEDGGDACGASAHADLVGQDRSVIASMTFPAPMRLIGPDDAVTMDFNPERLNVTYDESGTIDRVYCG